MDPISITLAVAAFLKTSISVVNQVRTYRESLASVGITLDGLCYKIETVNQLVESFTASIDEPLRAFLRNATGHVGAHCRSLEKTLEDSRRVLRSLQDALEKIRGPAGTERARLLQKLKHDGLSGHITALEDRLSFNLFVIGTQFGPIQFWKQEMWLQFIGSQTQRSNQTQGQILEQTTFLIQNHERMQYDQVQTLEELSRHQRNMRQQLSSINQKLHQNNQATQSGQTQALEELSRYQSNTRLQLEKIDEKLSLLPAHEPERAEWKSMRECVQSGWALMSEASTRRPLLESDTSSVLSWDPDALFSNASSESVDSWLDSVRDEPFNLPPRPPSELPAEQDGPDALEDDFDVDIARSQSLALFKEGKQAFGDGKYEDAKLALEASEKRLSQICAYSDTPDTVGDKLMLRDVYNALYELHSWRRMSPAAAGALERISGVFPGSPKSGDETGGSSHELERLWLCYCYDKKWQNALEILQRLRKQSIASSLQPRNSIKRHISKTPRSSPEPSQEPEDLLRTLEIELRMAAMLILQERNLEAKQCLRVTMKSHGRLAEQSNPRSVFLTWHLYSMALRVAKAMDDGDVIAYKAIYDQFMAKVRRNELVVLDGAWEPGFMLSQVCGASLKQANVLVMGRAEDRQDLIEILLPINTTNGPRRTGYLQYTAIVVHEADVFELSLWYCSPEDVASWDAPYIKHPVLRTTKFDFVIIETKEDNEWWRRSCSSEQWISSVVSIRTTNDMPIITVNIQDPAKAYHLPFTKLLGFSRLFTQRPHPGKIWKQATYFEALQLFTGTKQELQEDRILSYILKVASRSAPRHRSKMLSRNSGLLLQVVDNFIYASPAFAFLAIAFIAARLSPSVFQQVQHWWDPPPAQKLESRSFGGVIIESLKVMFGVAWVLIVVVMVLMMNSN